MQEPLARTDSATRNLAQADADRNGGSSKLRLWQAFCAAHAIAQRSVPLFQSSGLAVMTAAHGRDRRRLLVRSSAMESLLVSVASRVLASGSRSDGVLYMMHWPSAEGVVPLYIGKAGRYGLAGGISANLSDVARDRSRFARWGSNYAYHVGDLSAAACTGHEARRVLPKYRRWAERIFEHAPCDAPVLKRPVQFWATAWDAGSPSIWPEYGASSLSFQEYLLIGVASDVFPDALLNREGSNRVAIDSATDSEQGLPA